MIIPVDQLDPHTLQAVIEEFVSRDGTDYGEHEVELAEKVAQVRRQLQSGEVLLVFDEASESCNLVPAEDYTQL